MIPPPASAAPAASAAADWLAMLPGPAAAALCALVVLATPLLCGLPLVRLLRGARAPRADDWLVAPFVGLGALVLLLQNLVYLEWPVRRSALVAFVVFGAIGLAWARRGRLRASLRVLPRALLALALLAYALHALALVQLGPRHWMGRLWEDQFSYTGMAQFFLDEPFSLDVDEAGQRPWLFRVLRPSLGRFYLPFGLKENRIGQSVLQAFYARAARGDAQALFGPTILLGAPLLVLGVGLLARRLGLGQRSALAAAWLAALAPAFTLLHLESFLSHALALGFFPAFLVLLDELGRAPGPGTFVAAALPLSFGVATYGELWLALLALAFVVLGLRAWAARTLLRSLLSFGALVVFPFVTNPRFMPMLLLTTLIGAGAAMHTAIYPFAYSLEGQARLWLGDLALAGPSAWRAAAGTIGLLLTLAGLLGLARLLLAPRHVRDDGAQGDDDGHPPSLALRVGVVCLALGALPFLLGGRHPYQFYKLMQTAAPALAIGLVALLAPARRLGPVALAVLLALATLSSARMVRRTAGAAPEPRSNAGLFLTREALELRARLEALRGDALVIGRGFYPLQHAWLSYFARRSAVWLSEPFLGRDRLERSPEAAALLDLRAARAAPLVLTRADDRSFEAPPRAETLLRNAAFDLWRPLPGPWVTLFDIDRPGTKAPRFDLSRKALGQAFAVGRADLRLRVLSGAAGRARVELDLVAGTATRGARLIARGCEPAQTPVSAEPVRVTLACDVRQGFDEVRLRARADSAADPSRVLDLVPRGVRLDPR